MCSIRDLLAAVVLALTSVTSAGCGSASPDHSLHGPASQTATAAGRQAQPQLGGPQSAAAGVQAHPHVIDPQAGQLATSPGPAPLPARAAPAPAPHAAASLTKAPAPGTLSDNELRAELGRFRAAVARYRLDQLNLAGALLSPAQVPPGPFQMSVASVFTDYGLPIACGGVLRVPVLGVAHKSLPCGTQVIFRYGGRAIRVPVIDRGPYITGRDWDLTGAAAQALGFPGLGYIEWQLG